MYKSNKKGTLYKVFTNAKAYLQVHISPVQQINKIKNISLHGTSLDYLERTFIIGVRKMGKIGSNAITNTVLTNFTTFGILT